MKCSSEPMPSPSRTSLLRLMRFISLTVPSQKSDWCPQSHSNDDGKISFGIIHLGSTLSGSSSGPAPPLHQPGRMNVFCDHPVAGASLTAQPISGRRVSVSSSWASEGVNPTHG